MLNENSGSHYITRQGPRWQNDNETRLVGATHGWLAFATDHHDDNYNDNDNGHHDDNYIDNDNDNLDDNYNDNDNGHH